MGQKTLANGTSEHYAYDTRSRLTQVQLKQGATVLRTTGYAWDNADQITSQTVDGVTTNYGYDLAGQLTSEVRTGYNVAYTYDANGNRLSKTVNGVAESYTYDSADKMLTAGAKSYTYDAAGRTVGINAPGGTTTLTYDYESRVTAISGPGINETHTYNGLDTRVGTVQGGVSRTFVRDGSYVTDPVLRDGQATYTPGVSERRGGVSTWSHSGLKNADAQTTSVGAIAATRVYDAFGAELSATGTWKGPFGYAGGFGCQEDSSGLKLLGHRYYDPTTGRFLSRDPIKDGRNWYVYCGSNPTARYDADGLKDRPLTPNEEIQIEKAIERLDAIGETDLAKITRDMLRSGAIRADEGLESMAEARQWPDGSSLIIVNPISVFHPNVPSIPPHVKEVALDWLTAIIGHESHHIGRQGYVWKRFHPNAKEIDAWNVSITILRKLRVRRTGIAAEAVDGLIERALEAKAQYVPAKE